MWSMPIRQATSYVLQYKLQRGLLLINGLKFLPQREILGRVYLNGRPSYLVYWASFICFQEVRFVVVSNGRPIYLVQWASFVCCHEVWFVVVSYRLDLTSMDHYILHNLFPCRAKVLPSNFLILIPVSDVEAMFISGWDWPDLLLSVVKVLLLSFVYSGFSSRLCSKLLWYHLWECRGLAGACRRIWDIVQGKWHTEKEREMFSSFNGKLQGYSYSLE